METKLTVTERPDASGPSVPVAARPEPTERIDPRAVRAWRVAGAVSTAIAMLLAISIGVIVQLLDGPWWLIAIPVGLAVLTGVIGIAVVPTVRWRQWRYAVSERDVDMKRGLIIITRTLIPMVRVQHVDTTQGPIMRYYGLASVIIATAAGAQEIPALSLDVAEALRDRIAALAGVAEDV